MKTNRKPPAFAEKTHEGAPAARLTPEQALRRSVMSCLLWESEFYEDGVEIGDRIMALAEKVSPEFLSGLAREARHVGKLRHVPLLLLRALVARGSGAMVREAIHDVISRADELPELLAIYWKDGRTPLAMQLQRGLASAFLKFDEYQLAKYDRPGAIRLRDVLFLSHAKPDSPDREAMWKRLANGELAAPDTWEVGLLSGGDKRETFERLLREGKLGYLALLRNLRNMEQAGVPEGLIRDAIQARRGADRVLPFRFFAAAKAAPRFEDALDAALLAGLASAEKLAGRTVVIVDVSGSMTAPLSSRSDMTRMMAASAVASIMREVSGDVSVYATGTITVPVPARRGMALVDAVVSAQREAGGGGIYLKRAMDFVAAREKAPARVVVVTDEQDCGAGYGDAPADAQVIGGRNYLINVASARNGIGYGRWTHIDGFSENVIRFIAESERG